MQLADRTGGLAFDLRYHRNSSGEACATTARPPEQITDPIMPEVTAMQSNDTHPLSTYLTAARGHQFYACTLLLLRSLVVAGCSQPNAPTASESSSTAASYSAEEPQEAVTLLNVSYDPTRELYVEFNTEF